ncbi:MAG: tetratricopeptide repeat protein [Chromatiales bacterium]|nr:tetratricopeptide repeat protein [Chromatiales bacterium]
MVRSLLLLTSLLALGLGLAPAAGAADLDEARTLARRGDFDGALTALDQVLAAEPNDPQARFLRGVVLAETRRVDEAIAVFTGLTRDYPELPEPHNNLAVLYAAEGEYDKARDALLVAINTHPSYATAHENLGDIYAKMAGLAYDRALSLDTANATAKSKLALISELFSTRAVAGEATMVAAAPAASPASSATAPPAPAPASPAPPVAATPTPTPTPPPISASSAAAAAGSAVAVPAPPTAAPAPGAAAEAVTLAVRDWAEAWSGKNVEAYLARYASGFRPPNGMSREAWERQRRQRLSAPAFIRVSLDDVRVATSGDAEATVTFVQTYRSDTYGDRVRKRLTMTRERGDWRILREQSDP